VRLKIGGVEIVILFTELCHVSRSQVQVRLTKLVATNINFVGNKCARMDK